jgi:phosphoribosylanthranilate isomerase
VKICGIRRLEDARLAVELGAAAIGFVFWPGSPRAIGADDVRAIVGALPPFVTTVGVFVNQPPDQVRALAERARVTTVQLHGDEDASAYQDAAFSVIKAIAVRGSAAPELSVVPAGVAVLLDAHDPVRRGGTGQTIDWTAAAAAARTRPIILSGGLTPDNVRLAIARVQPYAVDLSSGVESAPGIKDAARLRALFEALSS